MRSLVSYLAPTVMRWTFRPQFTSVEAFHAGIKKSRQNATNKPPPSFAKHVDAVVREVGGAVVWDLRPKGLADKDVKGRLLYIPGGAFCLDIVPGHWMMARFLAQKLDFVVTVALYPLAPEHQVAETYAMMELLYDGMASSATADVPFYAAGDSAGGCLALALTQLALQMSKPLASRLVLISPLLDQTFSNPKLRARNDTEPTLHLAGVQESVRLLAPGLDPKTDIRLSPMYGPVDGLPPVLLLAGGNDFFTEDANIWVDKAKAKVDVEYVFVEGMVHCWPIGEFHEARMAREQIANWISTSRPRV